MFKRSLFMIVLLSVSGVLGKGFSGKWYKRSNFIGGLFRKIFKVKVPVSKVDSKSYEMDDFTEYEAGKVKLDKLNSGKHFRQQSVFLCYKDINGKLLSMLENQKKSRIFYSDGA